jgi:hypothetical protein
MRRFLLKYDDSKINAVNPTHYMCEGVIFSGGKKAFQHDLGLITKREQEELQFLTDITKRLRRFGECHVVWIDQYTFSHFVELYGHKKYDWYDVEGEDELPKSPLQGE